MPKTCLPKGQNYASGKYKGYTLIEVLVSLTIIGLIFSYGFVNFRDFARRQAVESAKRRLIAELRLTQELAFSGQKPENTNCTSPNTLDGYYFEILSSTRYKVAALCSGGEVDLKEVDLTGGIFLSIPSPNPILFKILGHGTNISSGEISITLSQSGTTNTQTVTISTTGEIK